MSDKLSAGMFASLAILFGTLSVACSDSEKPPSKCYKSPLSLIRKKSKAASNRTQHLSSFGTSLPSGKTVAVQALPLAGFRAMLRRL